jgi:Bardet-Biedl syndrome 7 protein
LWSLEGAQTNGSSVSVVKTCNFDGETTHGFIVARDDGSLEVYSYDHKSPYPILRFETKIAESITGLDLGYISTPGKQEILITTYSGKVMSLVEKSAASKIPTMVIDKA